MITPDDNAKRNYERVKRWREKNRALVNLKQRNYRKTKKNLPVPVLAEPQSYPTRNPEGRTTGGEARESTQSVNLSDGPTAKDSRGGQNLSSGLSGGEEVADVIQSLPPAQSKDENLERLRGLVKQEEEKPAIEPSVAIPARFGTYRDDGGLPITEKAWNELQKRKERAAGKYEIDDYSQA
jgi:hypothetical protein